MGLGTWNCDGGRHGVNLANLYPKSTYIGHGQQVSLRLPAIHSIVEAIASFYQGSLWI